MSQTDDSQLRRVFKRRRTWQYTFGLLIPIVVVAIGSLIVAYSYFQPIVDNMSTFWVSFVVGVTGASVYLLLLLMTESKLKILENQVIGDLPLMTLLYVMSGGFVAAVVQTSTGVLTSNGLQAVFMVGFGWQGALSGVGASGSIRKATETFSKDSETNRKDVDAVTSALERSLEETREDLKMAKERVRELLEKKSGG